MGQIIRHKIRLVNKKRKIRAALCAVICISNMFGNTMIYANNLGSTTQETKQSHYIERDGALYVEINHINEMFEMIGRAFTPTINREKNELTINTLEEYKNDTISIDGINYLQIVVNGVGRNIGYVLKDQLCYLNVQDVLALYYESDNSAGIYDALSIADSERVQEPKTVADFEKLLGYMLNSNQHTLTLRYNNEEELETYKAFWQNCYQAFEKMFRKYPEHFAFVDTIQIKYRVSDTEIETDIILKPNEYVEGSGWVLRHAFIEDIEKIREALFEQNRLNDAMTQREMAYEIYKFVATTLAYDEAMGFLSYTGYGASTYDTAVCQGYVALYNALCRSVGIDCIGVIGTIKGDEGLHTWTMARLDGEYIHIDPTFGDPVPNVEGRYLEKYFDIDEVALKETHQWDDLQISLFKQN